MESTLKTFAGISHQETTRIAQFFMEQRLDSGETIFEEGAAGDCVMLVREGTVKVLKGDVQLAALSKGHAFGEMSLLEHRSRSATCVAASHVELLVLTEMAIERMMRMEPVCAAKIYKAIAVSLAGRFQRASDTITALLWADA